MLSGVGPIHHSSHAGMPVSTAALNYGKYPGFGMRCGWYLMTGLVMRLRLIYLGLYRADASLL